MKTFLFVAAAATLVHASAAARPSESLGRLTGDQVVKIWIKQAGKEFTGDQQLEREFVSGYLAGAADAAEGVAWCDTLKVKAHEIDAEVVWSMKAMPLDRLKTKEGAKFIVEILADRFPCKQVEK